MVKAEKSFKKPQPKGIQQSRKLIQKSVLSTIKFQAFKILMEKISKTQSGQKYSVFKYDVDLRKVDCISCRTFVKFARRTDLDRHLETY
jgi:hypothetical protein